eukprot:7391194-Prymnesium_polylepis.1
MAPAGCTRIAERRDTLGALEKSRRPKAPLERAIGFRSRGCPTCRRYSPAPMRMPGSRVPVHGRSAREARLGH